MCKNKLIKDFFFPSRFFLKLLIDTNHIKLNLNIYKISNLITNIQSNL
jgi:hypothetical protein